MDLWVGDVLESTIVVAAVAVVVVNDLLSSLIDETLAEFVRRMIRILKEFCREREREFNFISIFKNHLGSSRTYRRSWFLFGLTVFAWMIRG